MKRFLILSFIFITMLFGLTSCNQAMLGVGSAIQNLITSPYRGIRDAISNHVYDEVLERTEKAKLTRTEKVQRAKNPCEKKDASPPLSKSQQTNLKKVQEEIRKNICSCKAWGTCSKEECSCNKLCPKTFELLSRVENISDFTKEENSLSFRNTDTPGFKTEHTMTAGFCWGHASVTSKFNRLAFFKPNTKPPYDIQSKNVEEQNKLIDYYKKQIDKILNNEVADFKGIANLKQLSSIPGIDSYIYDKMGEIWADNAMTFQGLFTAFDSFSNKREENEEFFKQVKSKLDNFQQPQIVFTFKNLATLTHASLVSHYYEQNGKTILCLRDNSDSVSDNVKCKNKMYLNKDGTIRNELTPSMSLDIGDIKIAHNDNREAVAQMNSLHKRCKRDKDCDT